MRKAHRGGSQEPTRKDLHPETVTTEPIASFNTPPPIHRRNRESKMATSETNLRAHAALCKASAAAFLNSLGLHSQVPHLHIDGVMRSMTAEESIRACAYLLKSIKASHRAQSFVRRRAGDDKKALLALSDILRFLLRYVNRLPEADFLKYARICWRALLHCSGSKGASRVSFSRGPYPKEIMSSFVENVDPTPVLYHLRPKMMTIPVMQISVL